MKAHSRQIVVAGQPCTLVFSMSTWRGFEQTHGISLARAVEPRFLTHLLFEMLGRPRDLTAKRLGALSLRESSELMAAASAVLIQNIQRPQSLPSGDPKPDVPLVPMDWVELEAIAWFDLRVPTEMFEQMSPTFFYALLARFDESVERFFMASSIVAATMVNIHSDPEKNEPLNPLAFSPTRLGEAARQQMETDKKLAIRAKILGLANIIPGTAIGEGGLKALQLEKG